MHTNLVGGAWGEDTWAALVRDDCDALDNGEDPETLEDTRPKRAVLIPIDVFTSSHIMRICTATGQVADYKKFGVDEETPSGVEDIRNSTQRTGSTMNLMLSDVSSIQHVDEVDEAIEFEELGEPREDDFLNNETEEEPGLTSEEETEGELENKEVT